MFVRVQSRFDKSAKMRKVAALVHIKTTFTCLVPTFVSSLTTDEHHWATAWLEHNKIKFYGYFLHENIVPEVVIRNSLEIHTEN